MAKSMNDGGPGVVLETRTEVILGGVSGLLFFFTLLPLGFMVLVHRLAYDYASSPFAAGIFVGGIMALVTIFWIRNIRSEWEVHKELFLSLPWIKV